MNIFHNVKMIINQMYFYKTSIKFIKYLIFLKINKSLLLTYKKIKINLKVQNLFWIYSLKLKVARLSDKI